MQIYNIQTINNSNANFRAKFVITGSKIDECAEKEFKNLAKNIGLNSDKIQIELGEIEYDTYQHCLHDSVNGFSRGKVASRSVKAISKINGVTEENDLSFYRSSDWFAAEQNTTNRIKRYLKSLLWNFGNSRV